MAGHRARRAGQVEGRLDVPLGEGAPGLRELLLEEARARLFLARRRRPAKCRRRPRERLRLHGAHRGPVRGPHGTVRRDRQRLDARVDVRLREQPLALGLEHAHGAVAGARQQERAVGRQRERVDRLRVRHVGPDELARVDAPVAHDPVVARRHDPRLRLVEDEREHASGGQRETSERAAVLARPQAHGPVAAGRGEARRAGGHGRDRVLVGRDLAQAPARGHVEEPNGAVGAADHDDRGAGSATRGTWRSRPCARTCGRARPDVRSHSASGAPSAPTSRKRPPGRTASERTGPPSMASVRSSWPEPESHTRTSLPLPAMTVRPSGVRASAATGPGRPRSVRRGAAGGRPAASTSRARSSAPPSAVARASAAAASAPWPRAR